MRKPAIWRASFFFVSLSAPKKQKDRKNMKVQFMSLGSGSSGNCYYLATEGMQYINRCRE